MEMRNSLNIAYPWTTGRYRTVHLQVMTFEGMLSLYERILPSSSVTTSPCFGSYSDGISPFGHVGSVVELGVDPVVENGVLAVEGRVVPDKKLEIRNYLPCFNHLKHFYLP